jgi:hypothetical protein
MCSRFLGDRLACHGCGAHQFVGQAFLLAIEILSQS